MTGYGVAETGVQFVAISGRWVGEFRDPVLLRELHCCAGSISQPFEFLCVVGRFAEEVDCRLGFAARKTMWR